MPVEAECFIVRRKNEDILKESYRVSPGSSENISFLGPKIKIVAFCDVENMTGHIWVKGINLHKQIQVFRYEDYDDSEGKRVSLDAPITIIGQQELAIFTVRGQKRQVYFSIDRGENMDKENDLDDAPHGVRPLVTV